MGPSLALALTSKSNFMIGETALHLIEVRRSGQPSTTTNAGPADEKVAYAAQNAVVHAFNRLNGEPARHWKSAGPCERPYSRTHPSLRKECGRVRSRPQKGHFICVALKP